MTFKLQPEPLPLIKKDFTKHLLVWCLFIIYESGSVFIATGQYGHLLDYILFYTLNIGMFYLNSELLLPSFFERRSGNWLTGSLLIIIETFIYLLVKSGLDYALAEFRHISHLGSQYLSNYLIRNLWRGLFFIGASSLYWSIQRASRYRAKVSEIEKRELSLLIDQAKLERDLAEIHNAYLQQQINPHFLFNALNFIYNSFYRISEPAARCVSKLADILRYSFKPPAIDGKSSLNDELEQIDNLIEINRQRFRFPIYVTKTVSGNTDGFLVPPLILLSFVENIFKHGNLKDERHPAILDIKAEPNRLKFYCKNIKKSQVADSNRENIGLNNTIKRLEYSYKDNYELKLINEKETFEIDLIIIL